MTQSNKETFIWLTEERKLPTLVSQRIVENYKYFESQVRKQEIALNSLYQGIT